MFKYGSKQDPSYGFGSRLKDVSGLEVPGPGSYENKSMVYSRIGGIMSREMRNSYADSKTPGPGNYEADPAKVKSKDPSWSLPKSPRDQMSKSTIIGPGAYDHDKNYKSLVTTHKGYGFGSETKLKYSPPSVPGPGQYDGKQLDSRKSIKIGDKLHDPSGMAVPGPGVNFNLFRAMKTKNTITSPGSKEVGNIHWEKVQEIIWVLAEYQDLELTMQRS